MSGYRRSNKKKTFRYIVMGIMFIVLVFGGFGAKLYYQNFVESNIEIEEGEAFLYISRNSTTEEVIDSLEELGSIPARNSLEWLASKKNYRGGNIVAGKYLIKSGMTNNALINHLRAGNGRLDVKVRFTLVRDLKQLSARLSDEVELDSADIYNWLINKDSIERYGFNKHTIISMFIPNTYYVDWDITVSELMQRMATEYKKFWNEDRKSKARAAGLTQSEVNTLASIVYWETQMQEDMSKIAGVYMNRLRLGMPLQADPTLIFAMGDYSIRRVLNKHKNIDSPFNTYKYKGLPPGPILVPPIRYIDAVLDHEKHDYLYFVAKEDFSGYSYFAKTYHQHLVYARKFQQALNSRGIYR